MRTARYYRAVRSPSPRGAGAYRGGEKGRRPETSAVLVVRRLTGVARLLVANPYGRASSPRSRTRLLRPRSSRALPLRRVRPPTRHRCYRCCLRAVRPLRARHIRRPPRRSPCFFVFMGLGLRVGARGAAGARAGARRLTTASVGALCRRGGEYHRRADEQREDRYRPQWSHRANRTSKDGSTGHRRQFRGRHPSHLRLLMGRLALSDGTLEPSPSPLA